MVINKIYSLIICWGALLFSAYFSCQLNSFSFTEIDTMQKKENKNMVIFISTEWCNYCKAMKNTTFKNKKIIEQLNSNFYFTELNAETKNDIYFFGRKFRYKPTGIDTGIHELAEQLGTVNGLTSYPTLVILNFNHEIIFQYSGFIRTRDLTDVLDKNK